jgi:signal transduction histidine kinase
MAFARKDTIDLVRLDLCIAVRELDQLLRQTLGVRYPLDIETASIPCPVLVNPTQFDVALLNLAVNACDAMPMGGTITIQLDQTKLGAPEFEGAADSFTGRIYARLRNGHWHRGDE